MSRLLINGFQLSYEKGGTGAKNLILIHGNLASKRWWDHVKQPLAQKFTVYSIDLRGCGDSEQPKEGYSVTQYGDDVLEFMHQMEINQAVLVGHSLGGAIAMDAASKQPERIEKLILLNSAPVFGFVTSPEKYDIIEFYATQRELLKLSLAAIAPTASGQPFFEDLVDDAFHAAFTAVPNAKSLSSMDYTNWARTFTHPVLLLYGEKDTLISREDTEKMLSIFPNSQMCTHPGVGHSPQVEDPDWFVNQVLGEY